MENSHKEDAVCPGSYDPAHNGHVLLWQKGAEIFRRLYVVASQNIGQDYELTLEERMEINSGITESYDNIFVDFLNPGQLLVNYMKKKGVRNILRSARNQSDFQYEMDMWLANSRLDPEISEFVFMPPREYIDLSSTRIREFLIHENWEENVRPLVHEYAFEKLKEKYENLRSE